MINDLNHFVDNKFGEDEDESALNLEGYFRRLKLFFLINISG